jgi:hypothetical protein
VKLRVHGDLMGSGEFVGDLQPALLLRSRVTPVFSPDGQAVLLCVGIEVVGDLVFGRIGPSRGGEGRAGERVALGGREQP